MLLKIRSAARGLFQPSSPVPAWSIPIALLLLTLLSYGLRALSLGFFWDDWPYLWFFHRFGPDGIIRAFNQDRPFLSFIYISSLSVLGSSIQAWQIFALLARWLCSLGFWWTLALAWPRQKNKTVWAAFLFAVYPGFTQQWIAVIYGQAFFLFAALFFSIGVTLWLARCRRTLSRGWIAGGTLLALALSGFCMFSTEYFFGLELLRPALLWVILSEDTPAFSGAVTRASKRWAALRQRALRTAAWWAPYLALMLVFVFWRTFIHTFPGYQMTTLTSVSRSPLIALRDLSLTILHDLITSIASAWGQTLQLDGFLNQGISAGLRMLGVILLTGLLAFLYLARLRPAQEAAAAPASEDNPSETGWLKSWPAQAMLVGLFAMLASGWPFWLTRLPLRMGFPQDRFSLPLAAGACLLLAGLVDLLGKDLPHKTLVLSIAVGLAAGFHTNTALSYRADWNTLEDFLWQVTWRAPSVQPNTLFVSESMPFRYFEDDSLTAPLNWTLDPNGHSTQMNYLLYDLLVRNHSIPGLAPGSKKSIEKTFRAAEFKGTASRVLVFYYAPPGCVRILDPVYDADLYRLPNSLLDVLPASNPRQLIENSSNPAVPPAQIFGGEPKHRWCYYFEKADLARQYGDWKTIVQLSRESISIGYRPDDPFEYLPFIEGFLRSGLWGDAYGLTQSTYADAPATRPALCALWKRSANQGSSDVDAGVLVKINRQLKCPASN